MLLDDTYEEQCVSSAEMSGTSKKDFNSDGRIDGAEDFRTIKKRGG